MKVALVGFPGSGKSKVGKRLARALTWQVRDIDCLFEERYKITIPLFFEKYGEQAFRKCEAKLLRSLQEEKNIVIACGGGLPCFEDNMQWLLNNSFCIYLQLSPQSLYNRLCNSKTERPLLANKSPEELLVYIQKTLALREPFYAQAHLVVKGENLVVEDLCAKVQQNFRIDSV